MAGGDGGGSERGLKAAPALSQKNRHAAKAGSGARKGIRHKIGRSIVVEVSCVEGDAGVGVLESE
jgi:hypothetical protein